MDLLMPGIGLIFWTSLAFLIVWFGLGSLAWKPIVQGLRERELSISEALKSSNEAQARVEALEKEMAQEKMKARSEREEILNEAREQAKKIIAASEEKAQSLSDKIMSDAQEAIENEKKNAMSEVRNQVAELSLEIAEKVLRKKLENKDEQRKLVSEYMTDLNLN